MLFKRQIKIIFLALLLNFTFIFNSTRTYSSGFLCTIEGIDGSGKSTLIQNLKKLFSETNTPILFTREPGATNLGKNLRTMLLERETTCCSLSEFLLFAADRAQHFSEFIIPELQKGSLIISDRMADSSIAYQGYLKGLDINMIKRVNSWCMQNIKPDITIYLKISAIEAKKRMTTLRAHSDKFEQELYEYLEKIIYAFDAIFAHSDNIITIDANENPEKIAHDLFKKIVFLYQNKQTANK